METDPASTIMLIRVSSPKKRKKNAPNESTEGAKRGSFVAQCKELLDHFVGVFNGAWKVIEETTLALLLDIFASLRALPEQLPALENDVRVLAAIIDSRLAKRKGKCKTSTDSASKSAFARILAYPWDSPTFQALVPKAQPLASTVAAAEGAIASLQLSMRSGKGEGRWGEGRWGEDRSTERGASRGSRGAPVTAPQTSRASTLHLLLAASEPADASVGDLLSFINMPLDPLELGLDLGVNLGAQPRVQQLEPRHLQTEILGGAHLQTEILGGAPQDAATRALELPNMERSLELPDMERRLKVEMAAHAATRLELQSTQRMMSIERAHAAIEIQRLQASADDR
jgi:hypothetical protein